jgi:hypothetical protein
MLVPRELDPVAAGARMPLPPQRPAPPAPPAVARVKAPSKTSSAVQPHVTQIRRPLRGLQDAPRDAPKSGGGWTMQSR